MSFLREALSGKNPFVLRVSIIAAIGGFLFGYDTGIIGGALLYIKKDLATSQFEQEALVGVLLVGSASFVSPEYISEQAPRRIRGGVTSFNQLMVVLGIFSAYIASFALKGIGIDSWRWMLGEERGYDDPPIASVSQPNRRWA